MKKQNIPPWLFLLGGSFASTSAFGFTVLTVDHANSVDQGSALFNTGTFGGNGRTCGTCHIPSKHYNVSPSDIAGSTALQKALLNAKDGGQIENATLVRQRALFNIGPHFGTGNIPPGPFRTSMTVGAMEITSVGSQNSNELEKIALWPFTNFTNDFTPSASPRAPVQLGWGGEGSPDFFDDFLQSFNTTAHPEISGAFDGSDCQTFAIGSLNSFAIGAVVTHATRNQSPSGDSIARDPGSDFTCPTADQLNQMDIFQKWLGRQVEFNLNGAGGTFNVTFPAQAQAAANGLAHFNSDEFGCNACHDDGGANAPFAGGGTRTRNFATNVEFFGQNPVKGVTIPPDEGNGFEDEDSDDISQGGNPRPNATPGPFFNSQPLIEAARKLQFFHNGSVIGPIEEAIKFYFSDTFNDSPGSFGRACAASGGVVGGDPVRCTTLPGGAGTAVVVTDDTDHFPTLASISAEFGPNAINETGLFLRALSAWYSANDCLRLIDETILRINNTLSTALPVQHIGFNLDDVHDLLRKAPLQVNYYLNVADLSRSLKSKIKDAATKKNTIKLLSLKASVQSMRDQILTFSVSPKTFNAPYDPSFHN